MELTSTLHIYKESLKDILNWTEFWNAYVSI